jgi:Lipase (class 3)
VDRLAAPPAVPAVPDDVIRFVLGVCSAYAYGDAGTVATMMDRLGLTGNRCRMISEYVDALFLTSTAYLIQSQDGRVAILCYRGTPPTSVITWMTNFQVEPVTIPLPRHDAGGAGAVHAGFYRNVRSTRFKLTQLLEDAIAGKSVLHDAPDSAGAATGEPGQGLEALYLTGHSLGGASAALLAASFVFDRGEYDAILKRLRSVYTYAAPMIGTPGFADACDSCPLLAQNVLRYVYANDIVPQLPPKAFGSFKHFGREYRYTPAGDDGRWERSSPRTQLDSLAQIATTPLSILAKALTRTRRIPFHASLSDHFPQYYLNVLTPPSLRSEFGE